ncbi:hypothetical protein NPS01_42750 [Nocardioides psychrotolerans]|uniref:HK97 gp10 family phage protein n=1 Tax=Nocardioides psychrotolerans TaxID=1005945 RepID=A0A1I3MAF1_9ACTN|nr:HK97 gp10 family phage protein [Nocardioides psychrotolerans]GEP40612.1 hypothetical protein NPS01_42750 [Nocardioides psychrotolerans]SFI93958.1 hypothetical protein SAMN05216561_11529 [Nocardioides psychrotolerans]
MAGEPIVVEGADELTRTLRAAAKDLDDLGEVNQRAAQTLLEKANPRTPRESGALASSGGVATDGDGATVTYDEVYAGVIHNGWAEHGIDPQPWLAETAAQQESTLVDVYVDHITDVLGRVRGL